MKSDSPAKPNRKKFWIVCSVVAGIVAFLAAVPAAIDTVKSATSAVVSQIDPPSDQERAVDDFVGVINTKLEWVMPPTIQRPSVEYFKRHFDQLNPYVPHPFQPQMGLASKTISVDDATTRLPELAGRFIAIEGKLTNNPSQVEELPLATSWAFFLADRMTSERMIVCRVPLVHLAPGEPLDYVPGDSIVAEGVLMADGAVKRAKPAGEERLIYMACSGVARRPVPEDGDLFKN